MQASEHATHVAGSICLSVRDRVATIVIDNPAHRNALTAKMCRQLAEAARAADVDPDVDVIVLRGAGSDFSAGAAIDEVLGVLYDGASPSDAGLDVLSTADEALCAIRKPLVSVVRGVCMGGGWQIAATADIIIAGSDSRLAVTPAKLGIVYPRRGLERLVRWVGETRAKAILLTGDTIDAATAEQWGLVTETIPEDGVDHRLEALISTLLSRSPFSAFSHKALVDAFVAVSSSRSSYDALWDAQWAQVLTAGDLTEGRAAFLEKRRPAFPWRPDSRKN
ncbi:Enoyl-CoA hydratase/carnithine racemase [Micrococcus luteus]|uniref:Enoyl-CoA hydratase/carnithine racemase n=2 Tax=Micrococcus luteus TaxID=1270 RepID=A0ABD7M714_MICLU|nr:Enoyl-CoA hydratase/carnithine racemase [Micrococcus luteus]